METTSLGVSQRSHGIPPWVSKPMNQNIAQPLLSCLCFIHSGELDDIWINLFVSLNLWCNDLTCFWLPSGCFKTYNCSEDWFNRCKSSVVRKRSTTRQTVTSGEDRSSLGTGPRLRRIGRAKRAGRGAGDCRLCLRCTISRRWWLGCYKSVKKIIWPAKIVVFPRAVASAFDDILLTLS